MLITPSPVFREGGGQARAAPPLMRREWRVGAVDGVARGLDGCYKLACFDLTEKPEVGALATNNR